MFARSRLFSILSLVVACALVSVIAVHAALPHDHHAPEFGGLMIVLHLIEQKGIPIPVFVVVALAISLLVSAAPILARTLRMLSFAEPYPLARWSQRGGFSPKGY